MTEQQAQMRLEAIKAAIRGEKDQGTTKQDLINLTMFDNDIIEEVYSE